MTLGDAVERWILLAEPERHSRIAHRDALVGAGYCVDEASDVDSLLELAHQRDYVVIITSARLMNGSAISFAEQLLELQRDAKYLLLGADPFELPRLGSMDGKLAGLVPEPGTAVELVSAVRRALYLQHDTSRLPVEGRPARLLLVEDDEADAQRMCEYLRHADPEVQLRIVKRLSEAVLLLRSDEFDAVLSDLTLPDARGLDAVTQLHAAAGGLPIVVVVSAQEGELAAHALELGAQDYLTKERLDERELLKSLRNAIERKRLESQLTRAAHYDPLSGLANRVLFHDRLAHALARSRREGREFAVLFVDLDRFKSVNDALGHEAGDALLRELGARLRSAVRESDTVARFGGDEFALLLETTSAQVETATAASRIIDSIAQPFSYRGTDMVVTASVGISTYPRDGETTEQLLSAADAAMYTAKGQGRNTFRHHRPNHQRAVENVRLLESLRRALERNEFELHFQPQIDLRTEEAVAVEALVRWRTADGSLIVPSGFMSALEQSGLIVEVGYFILDAACAQLHAWAKQGRSLRMAVNVSACELRHRDFVPRVQKTLQAWHLEGPELELEVTETHLAADNDNTLRTLRRLRDVGTRFAVDDFGTGFISLDYLRHLPLDAIKIDSTFVHDIPNQSSGLAIASAVIRLGERLGIDVIAEGVETYAQLDVLAREGCGRAQGYVCARPLPADRVWEDFDPKTLRWNSKAPPPDDTLPAPDELALATAES
jgi:diguanylate cyclase (GGDEF)-like protein